LLKPSSTFTYIDPPYHGQGKRLYRYFFSERDHAVLADILKKSAFPWLLSYDDTPFIRSLYSTSNSQKVYFDHRVKTSRIATELVISNLEIPPPVYEGFATAEFSGAEFATVS
jgi:DNA adenine methylase